MITKNIPEYIISIYNIYFMDILKQNVYANGRKQHP